MAKWNITFTITGPGGTITVPNKTNPVESTNLASLLTHLSTNLPEPFGLKCIGIVVYRVDEN